MKMAVTGLKNVPNYRKEVKYAPYWSKNLKNCQFLFYAPKPEVRRSRKIFGLFVRTNGCTVLRILRLISSIRSSLWHYVDI